MKQWYEENKERKAAKAKQWYKENKERCIAKSKQWREENKERCAAKNKQWREKNKERKVAKEKQWYEENKEYKAAKRKQWCGTERGRLLTGLSSQLRRQRKKNLATNHDLTTQEWLDIVYSQDHICAGKCHRRYPTSRLTVDHIYPLSRGGLLVRKNVQALCKRCNSSKGSKLMRNWMKEW
uniref:Putative homing endonuclease n=1 Tax=viral metagenome TaxID=1070528 RepID=A0A6M3IIH1_9ZZZZ